MYFDGGNFQAVCVELIGVVKSHLFHSPPYISNLLWGAFCYPTGIDLNCHTSFSTVFVTAWVLAVNKITRSKATSANKNLSLFSDLVKVCLSRSQCVWILFFLNQEIKTAEKKSKSPTTSMQQTRASSRQSMAKSASNL